MRPKRKRSTRQTYWAALGLFANQFSKVERALYLVFVRRVGIPLPIANALFPGLRVDAMSKNLRRLAFATSRKRHAGPFVETALVHLKAIADLRNDILHYGTGSGDDYERIVSNELRAFTAEDSKKHIISAELLSDLTHDLGKIRALLIVACLPDAASRGALSGATRSAWRYKLPQQPKKPKAGKRRQPKPSHPGQSVSQP